MSENAVIHYLGEERRLGHQLFEEMRNVFLAVLREGFFIAGAAAERDYHRLWRVGRGEGGRGRQAEESFSNGGAGRHAKELATPQRDGLSHVACPKVAAANASLHCRNRWIPTGIQYIRPIAIESGSGGFKNLRRVAG